MTKYEWETELKKNIHRLPKSEQDKALDYYNELFADKAESGMSETQIISEFGNPCDVADKILAEYQYDLRPAESGPAPGKERPADVSPTPAAAPVKSEKQPAPQPEKKKETVVESVGIFIGGAFKIVFGILGGVASAFLWLAIGIVLAVGFSMLCGGVVYMITALVSYTAHGPALFAVLGIGLISSGIGLMISLNCKLLCKTGARVTRSLVGKK